MITRLLRHTLTPPWRVRQLFPSRLMRTITTAIHQCETRHRGEIRFAVEASLDVPALLRKQTARERAIAVFAQLGVWDTEHNNGVLIYVLLADHDVEIIADRGINRHVGREAWETICREMELDLRQQRFQEAMLHGISAVSAHLARHYPGQGEKINELPDQPVIL
jgi:uncharacterized membrane protein